MTVTNTNAAELNETQLDQVVGAGGFMPERKGTAGSNVVADGGSAPQPDGAIIVHERKGK
jgi:hypothetical protein